VKIERKKKEHKEVTNIQESQKDDVEDMNEDTSKNENAEDANDKEDEDKKEENDSPKQKRYYKKKIDIRQGEKDYKKYLGQFKIIKSKGGNETIKKMDEKLCSMIIAYRKKLQNEGVNVASEVADADIVEVPDSDDENNNNYVDLDTVGAVFES